MCPRVRAKAGPWLHFHWKTLAEKPARSPKIDRMRKDAADLRKSREERQHNRVEMKNVALKHAKAAERLGAILLLHDDPSASLFETKLPTPRLIGRTPTSGKNHAAVDSVATAFAASGVGARPAPPIYQLGLGTRLGVSDSLVKGPGAESLTTQALNALKTDESGLRLVEALSRWHAQEGRKRCEGLQVNWDRDSGWEMLRRYATPKHAALPLAQGPGKPMLYEVVVLKRLNFSHQSVSVGTKDWRSYPHFNKDRNQHVTILKSLG